MFDDSAAFRHRGGTGPLARAGAALAEARAAAHLHGDSDQAKRLEHLHAVICHEREYRDLLELGYPLVRCRVDRPRGATIGWLIDNCAAVRAARAAHGIDDGARGGPAS